MNNPRADFYSNVECRIHTVPLICHTVYPHVQMILIMLLQVNLWYVFNIQQLDSAWHSCLTFSHSFHCIIVGNLDLQWNCNRATEILLTPESLLKSPPPLINLFDVTFFTHLYKLVLLRENTHMAATYKL